MLKTWLRMGDASEYESHEGVAEAAYSLKDMLGNWDRKVKKQDVSFCGKGVCIKGLFEGHNYISLFHAEADMTEIEELSKSEKKEFLGLLTERRR